MLYMFFGKFEGICGEEGLADIINALTKEGFTIHNRGELSTGIVALQVRRQ